MVVAMFFARACSAAASAADEAGGALADDNDDLVSLIAASLRRAWAGVGRDRGDAPWHSMHALGFLSNGSSE